MKKILFLLGMMVLPMLIACSKPQNSGNPTGVAPGPAVEGGQNVDDGQAVEGGQAVDGETEYDILQAFDNLAFVKIIKGETVPVKVVHGLGGEGGYMTDASENPEIIQSYIEAFRNLKIKEIYTDEEEFTYTADGINDYIFTLEDGSEVLISLDLSKYTIKDGKQYVYEYSEELHELNNKIAEPESAEPEDGSPKLTVQARTWSEQGGKSKDPVIYKNPSAGEVIYEGFSSTVTVKSVKKDKINLTLDGCLVEANEDGSINMRAESLKKLTIAKGDSVTLKSQTMDGGVTLTIQFE